MKLLDLLLRRELDGGLSVLEIVAARTRARRNSTDACDGSSTRGRSHYPTLFNNDDVDKVTGAPRHGKHGSSLRGKALQRNVSVDTPDGEKRLLKMVGGELRWASVVGLGYARGNMNSGSLLARKGVLGYSDLLSRAYLRRLDSFHHGLLSRIALLEKSMRIVLAEYKARGKVRYDNMSELNSKLYELCSIVCQVPEEEGDESDEEVRVFMNLGGTRLCLEFLKETVTWAEDANMAKKIRNAWFNVLSLLHNTCFCLESYCRELGGQDEIIVLLFELLKHDSLVPFVCGLCEELLGSRKQLFDLTLIGSTRLESLVKRMDALHLGEMCRALVQTVYITQDEVDENGQLRQARSLELLRVRYNRNKTILRKNQEILLECPSLLKRVVLLLHMNTRKGTVLPPSARSLLAEIEPSEIDLMFDTLIRRLHLNGPNVQDDWTYLSNYAEQFHHSDGEDVDSDEDERLGDYRGDLSDSSSEENGGHSRGISSAFQHRIVAHKVDALFLICCLMTGKAKHRCQDMLRDYGFVHALKALFREFDWNSDPNELPPPEERQHGPTCQCNPTNAVIVQFLRSIHRFCDRNAPNKENKNLLLSARERREAEYFNNTGRTDFWEVNSASWLVNAEQGLVYKLIIVLKAEPRESSFRYWLTSTVETFLRGSPRGEQYLVVKWGLLDLILSEFLSTDYKSTSSLQTNFDLLGEILKHNEYCINQFLDRVSMEQFETIMDNLAMDNLADSNVFLRSLMLSMNSLNLDESCIIVKWFRANEIKLIRQLLSVVTLANISQDSICAVNTTLLFFIFAHRRNRLAHLLRIAFPEEHQLLRAQFRRLLWYWGYFYDMEVNESDCIAITFTTGIDYSVWSQVVSILCKDDGSPTSLLSEPVSLPRFSKEVELNC